MSDLINDTRRKMYEAAIKRANEAHGNEKPYKVSGEHLKNVLANMSKPKSARQK